MEIAGRWSSRSCKFGQQGDRACLLDGIAAGPPGRHAQLAAIASAIRALDHCLSLAAIGWWNWGERRALTHIQLAQKRHQQFERRRWGPPVRPDQTAAASSATRVAKTPSAPSLLRSAPPGGEGPQADHLGNGEADFGALIRPTQKTAGGVTSASGRQGRLGGHAGQTNPRQGLPTWRIMPGSMGRLKLTVQARSSLHQLGPVL